jgi:hypothetical protein
VHPILEACIDIDGGLMAIKRVGTQGVLVTQEELSCWRIYRRYQRQQLFKDAAALDLVVWPLFLRHLQWPISPFVRCIQALLVMGVWPLLFIGALTRLLVNWLMFPARFIATLITPNQLQAPGEKSLLGLHNAFACLGISSIVLSEPLYIACFDEWIGLLYGDQVAKDKSLGMYIRRVERERAEMEVSKPLEASLRDEVAVARERLSRDLGHYLVDVRPVKAA